MTSAPEIHPGATGLAPYRQGELDTLCGLYALINAIRILHAKHGALSDQKCRDLFKRGMKVLARRHPAAARHGISPARQTELAKTMLKSAALAKLRTLKFRQYIAQITCADDFEVTVRGIISRGNIILVSFEGRISHHSVIVGVTSSRVMLFDSAGMRFVNKTSLQFEGSRQGSLSIESLMSLELGLQH